MVKCEVCGKKDFLPYKCSYCGGRFCNEHRLPEKHQCNNIPTRQWDVSSPAHRPIATKLPFPTASRSQGHYTKTPKSKDNLSRERGKKMVKKKVIVSMLLISILSVYGANLFLSLPPYSVAFMRDFLDYDLNLMFFIGLTILTLGHELLHTHAWKYFGYNAKVVLVLPMFGLARGTKPRNYKEHFLISMAPILLTIVALVFSSSEYSDYQFLALLNTIGMGYDLINALSGP